MCIRLPLWGLLILLFNDCCFVALLLAVDCCRCCVCLLVYLCLYLLLGCGFAGAGVGCLECFGCLGLFGWGCLYLLGCLVVGRMR